MKTNLCENKEYWVLQSQGVVRSVAPELMMQTEMLNRAGGISSFTEGGSRVDLICF